MTLTRFADVVSLSPTRTADPLAAGIERFVGLEHIEPENLHIRNWGKVADGTTFTSTFKRGQVLFGKRRAYQRKVAVADFDGVCSSDIYVFESKDPNLLLPELLPFICQSEGFYQYAIKTSAGSLSPRTNWSHLANYEFPLPPVEEQHRIADLLWAVDDVCEKYAELLQALEKVLAAKSWNTFNHLLDDNIKFVKLSEICSRLPQSGLYKSKEFYGTGFPVVHMGELFGNDCIDENTEMQLMDLSEKELSNYKLTDNDLLFGRRSIVLEGAGRCVYIGRMTKAMAFESSMIRVTLDKKIANNRFVFEWFRSPLGAQKIDNIRTFTTVAGVKGSDVAKLQVPLPSLEIQKEIVGQLSDVRNTIHPIENSLNAAKNMRRALLESSLQGNQAYVQRTE